MSSTIFSQSNTIMSINKNRRNIHNGRQPNSRTHIVRKNQKGRSIRPDSFGGCHAIDNSSHRMFTDAKMQISSGMIRSRKGSAGLESGISGRRQVGSATKEIGNLFSLLV